VVQASEVEFDGARERVHVRRWAAHAPERIVVLVHGYAEHAGRYDPVADALVADGATVAAPDHVGHGRTGGERGLIPDFDEVVRDVRAVCERERAEQPGLPVVLVGHSMGGGIAARCAQEWGHELAALVLSGPVLSAWSSGRALLALDPIPETPLDPEALSRDPEVGRVYAADPLVYRGPFRRDMLLAWQRLLDALAEGRPLGSLPTLWLHGADDPLVPLADTRTGIERLGLHSAEERVYPGARHEVFNEMNRDEVLADLVAFVRRTTVA
jgi:acylglycerol lipase